MVGSGSALSRLRIDFHLDRGEPITWIISRYDTEAELVSIRSGPCEPFGTGQQLYDAAHGLLDEQLRLW